MKKLSYYIIVFILFVFIVEIVFRSLGYKPFQPYFLQIKEIKPTSCLQEDSSLGYSLQSGNFIFDYVKDYSFSVTHDFMGRRICSKGIKSDSLRKVYFYGGSLFYGFGLNDSLTFPWKFQKEFENLNVKNYSIFGQSPAAIYYQLKEQIENNNKPDIAIITYANYNTKRVVYSNNFRRALYSNKKQLKGKKLFYLFARVEQEQLVFHKEEIFFKPFFLSEKLATINFIERRIDDYYDSKLNEVEVHILLMEEIIKLCIDNSIKPVVFAVRTNSDSKSELQKLKTLGASVIISNAHYKTNNDYNLLPYDNHPNSTATTMYKDELCNFFKENNL